MSADKMREALKNIDWQQVVENGGPPCFHLDPKRKRFCLRAAAWPGHGTMHEYVPLAELFAKEFYERRQDA